MLTESYFVSVAGQPLSNNTTISKDAGIYEHTLHPSHSTTSTFKKSSAPRHCLAVSDTHVFTAQEEKSTVHVYSRAKGNQEALVTFPERIRSIALQDDVLYLGSQEGRLIIWEVCTGRQVTTSACHVQAITCIAVTPYHLLTGSEDSNINVWSIPRLLELDSTIEHEPQETLSNHRAAITSLAIGSSVNPDTNICVSASKDKSCVIWNYQHGVALRTLLFPSSPLCVSLDPCARAIYVSSDDGSLYAIDLFADKALLGPQSIEDSSTAVQVSSAFGATPQEAGAASCMALSYDGTTLITGHPQGQILRWDLSSRADSTELTNLNASVTNIVFVSPLPTSRPTKPVAVVKPFLGSRSYNFTSQLDSDISEDTKFSRMLKSSGLPHDVLEQAILAFQTPAEDTVGDQELRKENEELWEVINEQRALQKKTLQRYIEVKSTGS
ncbi:WD40 repeat-like protein [Daldinia loculata]|uniref:WD40 repeat-like protein n=1 Tax=Daldinia loculata TaxID=103429 RepID=UPI0020C38C8D|nr:WD40 repeat-like protein [Daldinia loculata]KAI1648313.1 WD40 repeat-like protein [Daldinia loculata]KAI2780286.1 WD40 repeat-like protein [Daldinia loculata]